MTGAGGGAGGVRGGRQGARGGGRGGPHQQGAGRTARGQHVAH